MSRQNRRADAGRDRTNLYSEITDRIIAELEAERVPWVQPWGMAAAKAPLAMPKNAATGRHYSGINVLLLWGAVIERGFSGQSWLTFRQALSLGGNFRKGERGTTVVYANRFVPEDEKRHAAETGEDAQAIPFLKRFTVFNTDQCEGLPEDVATSAPPIPEGLIEPTVEALIEATGIDFRVGGNRAFYVPAHDYVQVPPPQAYFEPVNWHRTALHELGHATGHVSRLNRDMTGSFGSKTYAFEELIAEISAAFCWTSTYIPSRSVTLYFFAFGFSDLRAASVSMGILRKGHFPTPRAQKYRHPDFYPAQSNFPFTYNWVAEKKYRQSLVRP
ncbi:ArdC family protein [Glycocaulis sp.]|uniref:ArdC family protein n=1 Tax=Glycocaulis sp. TaxID=1969725 RepID=UPI003D1C6590